MSRARDRFTRAICRRPSPDLAKGLTTADLGAPDPELALAQHAAYVSALEGLGLRVTVLEPLPGFPDAHFVEDTAVVLPEVAVIARPGHPSRRGETGPISDVLAEHRPLHIIEPPGALDGGDVLRIDRTIFVGLSARTDEHGAAQLAAIVEPHGYRCVPVPVRTGLHLKSSVNELDRALLATAEYASNALLAGYEIVVVPTGEEYAANTLRIGDHLLTPAGFPGTRAALERTGRSIVEIDLSEMRKMDGGLTCLSLRF
jgi:dimethylargininase